LAERNSCAPALASTESWAIGAPKTVKFVPGSV
jgi:hypothetical protein